jgi:hypothetical protein
VDCKSVYSNNGRGSLHEEVKVVVVLTRILLVGSNSMASSAPTSDTHVDFSSDTIFVVNPGWSARSLRVPSSLPSPLLAR